ncbi:hypothetical protein ACQHIV_19505 [Kribbella sp. GL6]|uniref:hypothetical protein n=1 Tax=Kribbella sp. GL6 TaxID=3419765 RepID=UPI003D01E99B
MSGLLVGAVGPADLIPNLERLAAAEFPELRLRTFVYDDEAETVDLVQSGAGVDAWLFTGVVPFSLARRAGVLRAPATYVRYRGTGLPRILGPLLADNPGTRSISIDTVPREQVQRLLRRADLAPVHVRVLEHHPDRDAEDFLRFHRRVARDRGGSIAITCVRSVYTQLAPQLPTVRLLPAVASMRTALRAVTSVPPTTLRAEGEGAALRAGGTGSAPGAGVVGGAVGAGNALAAESALRAGVVGAPSARGTPSPRKARFARESWGAPSARGTPSPRKARGTRFAREAWGTPSVRGVWVGRRIRWWGWWSCRIRLGRWWGWGGGWRGVWWRWAGGGTW